jgi:hypothetical protein
MSESPRALRGPWQPSDAPPRSKMLVPAREPRAEDGSGSGATPDKAQVEYPRLGNARHAQRGRPEATPSVAYTPPTTFDLPRRN